ncbi:hypothetical protein [Pseudomonas sp. zfem002]|uniref:hypothetical protein n=1 Tax=Pseudomonas sp. zfem002 TaxID=3078197 RepID=UPI0029293C7F|nr:hypothetical protein [Pseudomonas sp. zfem002]MDU9393535.1 hypothetical protein [Pseudomonas sp. zfem002]
MNQIRVAFVCGCIGLATATVQAEPLCDCSKIVGQCTASINLKSVSGSKPSFMANYTITSSTASCSKVSYFIDGTPYFNVLAGTNKTDESTFGTEPISMKSFSGVKCEVCQGQASQAGAGSQGAAGVKPDASAQGRERYNGSWRTDLYVLTISNAQASPAVIYQFDRVSTNTQGSADEERFEGDTLVFSWVMGMFGRNSCRFNLTGQNSAVARCGNFMGTHTKEFTRM